MFPYFSSNEQGNLKKWSRNGWPVKKKLKNNAFCAVIVAINH
jgi:hypothetical protein